MMKFATTLLFGIFFAAAGAGDYYINMGYDFATGESVAEKRNGIKSGKLIWQKRSEGHSKLYKKYGISHPEPLIRMVCGTEYTFSPFKIMTNSKGWQFWRYDYYILRDRPAIAWDGYAPEHQFFEILQKFEPPPDEVKAMFEACVKMMKDATKPDEIISCLQKCYDRYEAVPLRKIINAYWKNPNDWKIQEQFWRGDNTLRHISENRSGFPDELPRAFYRQAIDKFYPDDRLSAFFRAEYLRSPIRVNAFFAAHMNLHIGREALFKELKQAGVLDQFLAAVMPEILRPLPPPIPEKTPRRVNQYWAHEYADIPRREIFLHWVTDDGNLKTHFRRTAKELVQ